MKKLSFVLIVMILLPNLVFSSPQLKAGKNEVEIRGKKQFLYFYPSISVLKHSPKILFAPGDGGWRGFAVMIAETLAAFGYDVYGLDTKKYLEDFTGPTSLQPSQVMNDFKEFSSLINAGDTTRITLVGWSEGAGLCLLGARSRDNKIFFNGVVTIGLNESTELGWRWSDALTYLTKSTPHEPIFLSSDYLAHISPLPIVMIDSTGDEYVSMNAAKRMFAKALEPKQFIVIPANNHRFDNNQNAFFNKLRDALQWIHQTR